MTRERRRKGKKITLEKSQNEEKHTEPKKTNELETKNEHPPPPQILPCSASHPLTPFG